MGIANSGVLNPNQCHWMKRDRTPCGRRARFRVGRTAGPYTLGPDGKVPFIGGRSTPFCTTHATNPGVQTICGVELEEITESDSEGA